MQPDAVGSQVQKYAKTVYQLEKGLPPNGVVPTLKFKVEGMKDMVSRISITLDSVDHHYLYIVASYH